MKSAAVLARYSSPLRYPGGKAKVTNFLKLLILENQMTGIDYVEPYAGGASAALSLLYEEYVDSIQINDLNSGVFNFWRLATSDPDSICRRIRSVPLTVEEWQRQRAIYLDKAADPDDAGFASFFLNRTNRSGIISGGIIGGLDQTGPWKLDARFDRDGLCARIRKVSRFSSRIKVTNLDALTLLRGYKRSKVRRLLYLDPPYYVKGSRLYDNFYAHRDHVAVRNAITGLAGPWIVSYDSVPEILNLYGGCTSRIYKLGYSAGPATTGAEAMFFSEDLKIPGVESPAGIHAPVVLKAKRAVMQQALAF